MAVRITLPKEGRSNYSVSNGIRVFTDDNREITDILGIDIRMRPGEIVTATIDVVLHKDTDLAGLLPLFEVKTLEELAESRGFKLVPYNEK